MNTPPRQDRTVFTRAMRWGIVIFLGLRTMVWSQETVNFSPVVGQWTRTDGGYQLQVTTVLADGSVSAAYFNPAPIHVSRARVSLWKGLVKLEVRLDDKGYPGSRYTLFYHEQKDALAGFYYQAKLNKQYEVVFLRKPLR